MEEPMTFLGWGYLAWTAIATGFIALSATINVVLFCIYQHKQKKLVQLDVAMKYLDLMAEHSAKLRGSINDLKKSHGSIDGIPTEDLKTVVTVFLQEIATLENVFKELKMSWLMKKLKKGEDSS